MKSGQRPKLNSQDTTSAVRACSGGVVTNQIGVAMNRMAMA